MKLLDWYRGRRLQRLNWERDSNYLGWEQSDRIGIYVDASHLPKGGLKAWINFLEEQGKQVQVLSYQDVKRKDLNANWPYPCICKDDLNWLSWPKGPDFQEFVKVDFDVLFDLSHSELALHELVVKHSSAKFKVSFSKAKAAWTDLIVECEKGGFADSCREEVLALLKFINAS